MKNEWKNIMDVKHKAVIEQKTWSEVRDRVEGVNPQLFAAIDALSPGKDLPLFLAKYPFGKLIVHKGKLQLPAGDGTVASIDSSNVSADIANQLKRRPVPMTLSLKNSAEVFYEMPPRIIALNLFHPGSLFGLWENLDVQQHHYVKWVWSAVSGARSVYMLPKITDATSHKELKRKYKVRSHLPRDLLDHWRIFVEIANSQAFDEEWNSEMLFFSDQWMERAVKDPAWQGFYNLILQEGWGQSQYWRNKVTFDIIWEIFTNQLIQQNIKPNPYFVSIIKHLVLVGMGVLPASVPVDGADTSGPFSGIQEAYINDYKLKHYAPTIFRPHTFSVSEDRPVYYSLQQPALLESAVTFRNMQSVYSAMPELIYLMESFKSEVLEGEIKAENTPIDRFPKEVICDYFHSDHDNSLGIRSTSDMPIEDKRLLTVPPGCGKRKFAETGNFIRGCVRFVAKSDRG